MKRIGKGTLVVAGCVVGLAVAASLWCGCRPRPPAAVAISTVNDKGAFIPTGQGLEMFALAASPDGRYVASAGKGALAVFDRQTGAEAWRQRCEGEEASYHIVRYLSNQSLIAGWIGDDKVSHVWVVNAFDGKQVRQLFKGPGLANRIAVSRDGKRTFISCENSIHVIRTEDGTEEQTLDAQGFITGLCCNDSGRIVVSCLLDGKVLVWDVEAGKVQAEMQATAHPLAVALCPEQEFEAVIGVSNGDVIRWAWRRGEQKVLCRMDGAVMAVLPQSNGAVLLGIAYLPKTSGRLAVWSEGGTRSLAETNAFGFRCIEVVPGTGEILIPAEGGIKICSALSAR